MDEARETIVLYFSLVYAWSTHMAAWELSASTNDRARVTMLK
jgi:hypothetical protein